MAVLIASLNRPQDENGGMNYDKTKEGQEVNEGETGEDCYDRVEVKETGGESESYNKVCKLSPNYDGSTYYLLNLQWVYENMTPS